MSTWIAPPDACLALLLSASWTSLTLHQGPLRQDSRFWLDNAAEWGHGWRYLNRVLLRNRAWFQEPERQDLATRAEGKADARVSMRTELACLRVAGPAPWLDRVRAVAGGG